MNIQTVDILALTLDPANVRKHGDRNLETIKGSLQRFGQQKPIVVNKKGVVIAGNGTLEAVRALGWKKIAAVRSALKGAEGTAYSIADNRTAELAEWDDGPLAEVLAALQKDESIDELVTGFDAEEIDQLIADACGVGEVVEDEVPEVAEGEPLTKLGDLWVMGHHRLLCGDSTHIDDVMLLMGDEKAQLLPTDPPYLVDYTGDRPNDSGKDWTDRYHEIDVKDAHAFYKSVFETALMVIAPHTAIYCWHAHKRMPLISRVWEELGILDHQEIVWVKPTIVFGRSFWHFQHEPCVMGWVKGSKPSHDGKHEHSTVWEIDWQGRKRVVGNEHPTQKPVEIFARPMRKHTKRGDICYEPFAGSGSQVIAAEQLERRCYSIEIEPVFVDVICKRWMKLTGRYAVRESDGMEFAAEVEAN